jgi:hypothetical protein
MANTQPERPRRNLTIVGLSPASLETLREIGRVVPADFHGTVFVVSDAGKGRLSRSTAARRHRENARPDAAAYLGPRPHPMENKERNRKRA